MMSIAYSAEAYNAGDHAGCFRFYAPRRLACHGVCRRKIRHPPARRALADLKAARDRTLKNADADHNAWTMRYAFDKTQIAWELQVGSSQGLMRLGGENFSKSQFDEAQDAYESAIQSLAELDGQPLRQIPIACRFAPLALANALFAQKQYKSAADAVTSGLHYLPEWPAITLDLRTLHHDPAEYEGLLEDLQAKAEAAPEDANLQFLLGYELYFTGEKAAGRTIPAGAEDDPNHAGAKMLLHPGQRPDDDEPRADSSYAEGDGEDVTRVSSLPDTPENKSGDQASMIAPKPIKFSLFRQEIEGRLVTLTPALAGEKVMGEWRGEDCLKNPLIPLPIDRYWNWNTHQIEYDGRILSGEKVAAVTGENEDLAVQGAIIVSTEFIDSVDGRPCLLVEFFSRRRNRPVLRKEAEDHTLWALELN